MKHPPHPLLAALFHARLPLFASALIRVGLGAIPAWRASPARAVATVQPEDWARRVASHLQRSEPNLAWHVAERSHLRVLEDLVAGMRHRALSPGENLVLDSLRDDVASAQRRLASLQASQPISSAPSEQDRAAAALGQAQRALQRFDVELSHRYPPPRIEPASLAQVRAAIGPGAAVLGWVELPADHSGTHSALWMYIVRASGTVRWIRLVSHNGPEFLRQCMDYRALLATRPRVLESASRTVTAARSMYEEYFAPAEPYLRGVADLVVIQPGPLTGVPLDPLVDAQGRLLEERFRIVLCPSATAVVWLAQQGASRTVSVAVRNDMPPTALLVGDPETSATFGRLAGSNAEIAAARTLFGDGARVLLRADASEAAMLALAPVMTRFQVLHFATHVVVDASDPGNCALILAPSTPIGAAAAQTLGEHPLDGRWTAREVLQEWRLSADLVVLSGCSTAFSDRSGRGEAGLSESFLRAGARHLILSLWEVDDDSTARLMQSFYREWLGDPGARRSGTITEFAAKSGRSIATALGRAKQEMRRSAAHADPWYWAGFVVVGAPD